MFIDESHITSSTNLKDEFRYLMEDVDESSSEANIMVTGIINLANSPHTHNKNVCSLLLRKDPQSKYNYSRIGFDLYKLSEGEYTFCIVFIPVTMNIVSVNVESTSLNINKQTTKSFTGYTRCIINMYKCIFHRQNTSWLI